MKLNDKRFWIFEAIVLICSIIAMVILWIERWFILPHILVPTAFCCLFLVGGNIAWKLYKGNQWWKLAAYTLLSTTILLAIVLFGFVWDWHDTGERPADLPPDVGTYITDNELVGIILLLWLIIAPILSCAISYITKRVIRL